MQRKQSPAFCLSGYLDNRAEGFPDIRQTWHGSGGSIYFLISEKGFAKIPTEKKTLYMELNVETVTVLLVTIGSVMLQWIKTYMETKLSYFVFQYPWIWLVVGLCCLAGISFAVPAGLYMLEKSDCEQ